MVMVILSPSRLYILGIGSYMLELFTKYFFAHDKVNYAGMIPVYPGLLR